MTTIAAGNTAEIYCPLSTSVTFTPGSGGAMRLGFAVRSGDSSIAPQYIQAATTVSISAGSTVFAEAIGEDATHTAPSGGGSSGGIRAFYALPAPASMSGTTEVVVGQFIIPAGVLGVLDRFEMKLSLSKSGTSETASFKVRCGTLGTIADAQLALLQMFDVNDSYGTLLDFKRSSQTELQKLGSGSPASAYAGQTTTNFPAAVTVGDMDDAAYYVSITAASGAAVETLTLQDLIVRLTPVA